MIVTIIVDSKVCSLCLLLVCNIYTEMRVASTEGYNILRNMGEKDLSFMCFLSGAYCCMVR